MSRTVSVLFLPCSFEQAGYQRLPLSRERRSPSHRITSSASAARRLQRLDGSSAFRRMMTCFEIVRQPNPSARFGAHIPMPQQLLDGLDVVAGLEQVRRKGVPQRMTRRWTGDPCLPRRLFDRPLQDGFVQVMPPPLAGLRVDVEPSGRKHPLPGPFTRSVGVLHPKRPRQGDAPAPGRHVPSKFASSGCHDLAQRARIRGGRLTSTLAVSGALCLSALSARDRLP
jgi:hypothetical protein